MREMMLTGRRLSAEDGQRLGISHELVDVGQTAGQAHAIALQIAGNAPLTNQLILTALPRIADMSSSDGLWAEALAAAVSQSTEDAIEGCALSSRNAHPSSAASDPSRPGTGQALALSRMRRAAAVYARRYFSDAPQGAIKTDALSGGEG